MESSNNIQQHDDKVTHLASLNNLKPVYWLFLSCCLVVLVGAADFYTSSEISFSLFYLFPIILSAWFTDRKLSLVICTLCAVSWFLADTLTNQIYSSPVIGYWNAIVRWVFFVAIAYLLPVLRELEHERTIARSDDLTGVANRRYFFQLCQNELNRAQRYNHPLTLIYVDIDDFKSVNDEFGHQAGDKLLCTFVEKTKTILRKTDVIARVGGDEFIIMLVETGLEEAKKIAPMLQKTLLEHMRIKGCPVTLSIGVITYQQGEAKIDDIVMRADALMYAVKKGTKNAINYAYFH